MTAGRPNILEAPTQLTGERQQTHVIKVLTVSSPGEVRQVELNLVPSLIQTHGHGADERLDPCSGLQNNVCQQSSNPKQSQRHLYSCLELLHTRHAEATCYKHLRPTW